MLDLTQELAQLESENRFIQNIHNLDRKACECFEAANELKMARAALKVSGLTDAWQSMFNVDGKLLEAIGVSEVLLVGKSEWAKVDLCAEGMLAVIGDFLAKGYQWLIEKLKQLIAWLHNNLITYERGELTYTWVRLATNLLEKFFPGVASIGSGAGKKAQIAPAMLGKFIAPNVPSGKDLAIRFSLIRELSFGINELANTQSFAGTTDEIFNKLNSITTKFSTIDPINLTTSNISFPALRRTDIDVLDANSGYLDLKSLDYIDWGIRNISSIMTSSKRIFEKMLGDAKQKLKVVTSAIDDDSKNRLEAELTGLNYAQNVNSQLIIQLLSLRAVMTQVIPVLDAALTER